MTRRERPIRLLIADSAGRRLRGLLGRAQIGVHAGLWFMPCRAIHTFGMRYAVDVLFLDRQDQVIRIVRSLAPWRCAIHAGASSVIELRAGTMNAAPHRASHDLARVQAAVRQARL